MSRPCRKPRARSPRPAISLPRPHPTSTLLVPEVASIGLVRDRHRHRTPSSDTCRQISTFGLWNLPMRLFIWAPRCTPGMVFTRLSFPWPNGGSKDERCSQKRNRFACHLDFCRSLVTCEKCAFCFCNRTRSAPIPALPKKCTKICSNHKYLRRVLRFSGTDFVSAGKHFSFRSGKSKSRLRRIVTVNFKLFLH